MTAPEGEDGADVEHRIEALRAQFAGTLYERIAGIRRLVSRLEAGPDPGAHEDLVRAVHTLAGTGGTFGFMALSQAAVRFEALLREAGPEGCAHPPARLAIREMLARLEKSARLP